MLLSEMSWTDAEKWQTLNKTSRKFLPWTIVGLLKH